MFNDRFSRISFLTDKRKANFVDYKPFLWSKQKKFSRFYNAVISVSHVFVLRLYAWRTATLETLKQSEAIHVSNWNLNRSVRQPPCITSCPGNERSVGCSLLSPYRLSSPSTLKLNISVVYDTAHIEQSTKDLLLYCYSTVKDSWLHPQTPQTYTQRDGKVFPFRPWGIPQNHNGFVGHVSMVATTSSS